MYVEENEEQLKEVDLCLNCGKELDISNLFCSLDCYFEYDS